MIIADVSYLSIGSLVLKKTECEITLLKYVVQQGVISDWSQYAKHKAPYPRGC